jgi:Holliday junction resolvase-like predicted endonuclease
MEPKIEQGQVGAHNEMLATVWLLRSGYHVFRNVSAHGPIDLIATKGGQLLRVDVKQSTISVGGERRRMAISREQERLGVVVLNVYLDGVCEIDFKPPIVGWSAAAPKPAKVPAPKTPRPPRPPVETFTAKTITLDRADIAAGAMGGIRNW